jgi:nickel-dependent lactate racemase
MNELRYGTGLSLHFDAASQTSFTEFRTSGSPLSDPATAVAKALAHPIDFPPFEHAIVPGDKLVLAVERDVPQAAAVVAGILAALVRLGVEPADVTVLYAAHSGGEEQASQDPGQPHRVVHDPQDRGQLAYLAATSDGEPVYMNRLLCDADVVLPIGCARLEPAGEVSLDGGLYPTFSDTKAQQRQPATIGAASGKQSKKHHDEIPDVGWMLGIQCIVQVVPGPSGSLLSILAGDPAAVTRRGRQLCEEAWRFSVRERASLVVAGIGGDASQQTWSHVGRAIAAAAEAVADDGAIAICCDLAAEPGPAVQTVAQSEDPQQALRRLRKSHPPDLEVAARLARAMQRAKLYLLSNLDETVVEDLGIAPVSSPAEVVRLAGRHKSCILLADAQHAVAMVEE